MIRVITLGRVLMAVGVIGLAIVGLIFHDFVRKWQPVPASLPLREQLVWVSNLLLLACGLGLLVPRAARVAAAALSLFLLSWILALQAPMVAAAPTTLGSWGYLAGDLAVASGALVLWAFATSPSLATAGRLLFALTIVFYGISHIVYAHDMASIVPAWLPLHTRIVYFTGLAHIAAGVALLSGIVPRLAVMLEAGMMGAFVLLVDLPHVVANPTLQRFWTALCFETAIVGAAWIVAGSIVVRRRSGIEWSRDSRQRR